MLRTRKFVSTKAAAGSAFSIKLQADGTDSVKLNATVTVGTGTPVVLTATDSTLGQPLHGFRHGCRLGLPLDLHASDRRSRPRPSSRLRPPGDAGARPRRRRPLRRRRPTPTPTADARRRRRRPTPDAAHPAPSNPAPAPGEFPSAATTGVPEGTKLTVHEGDLTVSTAGAVIDGLEVRGLLIINAPDVVIKNSRIVGRAVERQRRPGLERPFGPARSRSRTRRSTRRFPRRT